MIFQRLHRLKKNHYNELFMILLKQTTDLPESPKTKTLTLSMAAIERFNKVHEILNIFHDHITVLPKKCMIYVQAHHVIIIIMFTITRM